MADNKKITADLDRLIKRASEVKTAGVKQSASISSKLDSADDGTSKMTTGEQAAKNKEESGAVNAASVDGGGKANVAGKSVENSTDGATAVSTSGDAGAKGAELSIKKDADNGEEKPQNKVAALRAQAAELHKAASALLTPFDHFMVKAARASEDKQVKTAAEAMPEDDLADAASDQLMEQLATGQVDDAAAAQILEEALAAGALTPEEVQQAAELAQGAASEAGAGEGAAPAAPVEPEAAPAAPVAPEAPVEGADAEMQAKLAAAEIGPEHPEYIAKLDALFVDDQKAGERYFAKVAGVLLKQAEEEAKDEKKEEGEEKEEKEEKKETPEAPKAEAPVAAPAQAAPVVPALPEAAPVDAMAGVNLAPTDPAEQQALEAIKAELGLNDQQLAELAATPAPAPMDKVAAAKNVLRAAIMSKVASLKN